jgi:hypothetical protein
MGVGLNLIGTLAKPAELESWFNLVWEWTSAEFPGMAAGAGLGQGPFDEHPCVHLRFHPAADPVKIWMPEASTVKVSADTASAGPGYHLFLCGYLHSLAAKFDMSWESEDDDNESRDRNNPTFFSRDPEQTYYQMFGWLATMASSANMMAGSGSFHLAMPPAHQFMSDKPLITCMGARSSEWLQAVSKNPGAGADVFPWLNPGVGAEFILNRALVHMWSDIRWCPPIADGDEVMMRNVLNLLAQAFKTDPNLKYPWREWSEIMGYLRIDDQLSALVAKKAKAEPEGELIGYRRNDVRVMLDQGWSVLVPGRYAESGTYDPSTQNHTWEFWDDDMLIWFTTYPTYGNEAGKVMPVDEAILELDQLQENIGELVEEEASGKIWRRSFVSGDPDKTEAWRFSSILLVPGRLAMTHVFTDKKSDLVEALNFFRNIDNSAGTSIQYLEQPKFPRLDLVCAS